MQSSTQKLILVWMMSLSVVLGASVWYLYAPGTPPEGQAPLLDLSEKGASFEAAFNGQADGVQIVAVLSAARRERLEDASALQTILYEYRGAPVRVHVIWEPEAEGASGSAPATEAMARIWDPRVRQYWDPAGQVGKELRGSRIAVFSRGMRWSGGPPAAVIAFPAMPEAMGALRGYVGSIMPSGIDRPQEGGMGLLSI